METMNLHAWKVALVLSAAFSKTTTALETQTMDDKTILSRNKIAHGRELIIGGEQAPKGRYPYFSTLDHYCGGTLIAPDTVMTAGHCLPSDTDSVEPHVGRYSFYDSDTSLAYQIVAMERHPHWKGLGEDEFRHDVALLFLNTTVDTPYIRLNRDDNLPTPGQQLTAMGVGFTSNDWEHAEKAMALRQVHLNYLPNEQCQLATNDNSVHNDDEEEITVYEGRIHPDHLCATGGPNNERDSCAYDSGSPIILEGDSPEEDVLVALVSWGEGCADPDFPSVNTRVSDLMDFIEQSVCEHSASPPPYFHCSGAPTENTTIFSPPLPIWFLLGCFVAATLYWIRRQRIITTREPQDDVEEKEGEGFAWFPFTKPNLERRQTGETAFLYSNQNSPASSRGSTGYDAIQTMDV